MFSDSGYKMDWLVQRTVPTGCDWHFSNFKIIRIVITKKSIQSYFSRQRRILLKFQVKFGFLWQRWFLSLGNWRDGPPVNLHILSILNTTRRLASVVPVTYQWSWRLQHQHSWDWLVSALFTQNSNPATIQRSLFHFLHFRSHDSDTDGTTGNRIGMRKERTVFFFFGCNPSFPDCILAGL